MARADLLIKLVRAGSRNDPALFRRTVEEMVAEEREKEHHVLADRLIEQLNDVPYRAPGGSDRAFEQQRGLVTRLRPRRSLSELILPDLVKGSVRELVEEQHRADLLRSFNLEPRHRVLLIGPPGNGKTSLAEAIAEALYVPMFVVSYEAAIGSYLGETASKLKALFEQARSERCLLFFDEFDVLGKERGDDHETGEIKRVVSSLLLQIDALPSYVVVVTATNHPELLDRAVWRRFQLRLVLPMPTRVQIQEWVNSFEARFDVPLGLPTATIAKRLHSLSFADLEEFGTDVQRRYVLSGQLTPIRDIVLSRLENIERRAAPTRRRTESEENTP